ncbi:MAG: hypothetical protein RRC34_06670 [Lentisphaeria bacterium]|nr:hypothetical protein [Lentisphaeria bacterium]
MFPLIGVEALCDADDNFKPLPCPHGEPNASLTLRNVPFGGELYRIDVEGGEIRVSPEQSE